jgi:cytochrome c biogenesis protein CcmG, thiol:disulfide interchange protein DsbE
MQWSGQPRSTQNKRRLDDESAMTRTSLMGLGLLALIGVLLAVGVSLRPRSSGGNGPAPLVGREAPNFSLHDTTGRTVSLSTFRGKPVLLNFWATWCIPCRTEMPLINRTYKAHQKDLRVLAVDLQEPSPDVNHFARTNHLAFTPLLDSSGSVSDLYGLSPNSPKPVTFWVDRSGKIRFIHYGQMDPTDIATGLKRVGL